MLSQTTHIPAYAASNSSDGVAELLCREASHLELLGNYEAAAETLRTLEDLLTGTPLTPARQPALFTEISDLICRSLNDPLYEVRTSAARLASVFIDNELPDPVRSELYRVIEMDLPDVRTWALRVIARSSDPADCDSMFRYLRSDDSALSVSALESLSRIENDLTESDERMRVDCRFPQVRATLARVAAQKQNPSDRELVVLLQSQDSLSAYAAAAALFGNSNHEVIDAMLEHPTHDRGLLGAQIALNLSVLSDAHQEHFLNRLESPADGVRLRCAIALKKGLKAENVDALARLLEDENFEVAKAAARSLVTSEIPAAHQAVLERVNDSSNGKMLRCICLELLPEYLYPLVQGFVSELFRSGAGESAGSADFNLACGCFTRDASPDIIAVLRSTVQLNRPGASAAMRSLCRIAGNDEIALALASLNHPSLHVVNIAAACVAENLTEARIAELLKLFEGECVRSYYGIFRALQGAHSSGVREKMYELLEHYDPLVAYRGASHLAEVGDATAARQLIGKINRACPPGYQTFAMLARHCAGDQVAIDKLIEGMHHDDREFRATCAAELTQTPAGGDPFSFSNLGLIRRLLPLAATGGPAKSAVLSALCNMLSRNT